MKIITPKLADDRQLPVWYAGKQIAELDGFSIKVTIPEGMVSIKTGNLNHRTVGTADLVDTIAGLDYTDKTIMHNLSFESKSLPTFVMCTPWNKEIHLMDTTYDNAIDELEFEVEREKNRPLMPEVTTDTIIITLSGGVAEVDNVPGGVHIILKDYDVLDDDEMASRDGYGDLVVVSEWGAPKKKKQVKAKSDEK